MPFSSLASYIRHTDRVHTPVTILKFMCSRHTALPFFNLFWYHCEMALVAISTRPTAAFSVLSNFVKKKEQYYTFCTIHTSVSCVAREYVLFFCV